MEERHVLNFWFDRYMREMNSRPRDAVRTQSWDSLWNLCFRESIGTRYPEDLNEGVIAEAWENAEDKLHSRADTYSAFLLLRSIFSYVEYQTERTLSDVVLPRSFVTPDRKLTEEGSRLLDEMMLSYSGRIAVCFWLVLHTPMNFTQVVHLKKTDIQLSETTVTVRYDPAPRARNKNAKREIPFTEHVVPVDDRAYAMFARFVDDFKLDRTEEAFNPRTTESRKRLTLALSLFCVLCGLPELQLEDLEAAERISCPTEEREWARNSDRVREICEKLERKIEKLPKPILEHFRRTRLIASFILEQIRSEEWFIDLGCDEYNLLFAVNYHDVGKGVLSIEDAYPSPRYLAEQNRRYRLHVEEGQTVVQDAIEQTHDTLAEESPEALLYAAVSDHHERLDGKGFPKKKTGDQISFVARLTGLADTLDHRLFVDVSDADTDEVLSALREESEGYDARLLKALLDNRAVFVDFIDELRGKDRMKRGEDAFGIRYVFRPYIKPEKPEEIVAYDAHLFFNDRYYGLLDSNTILPLMEEHPSFQLFTRLQVKRLLRLVFAANVKEQKLPPVFLPLSVKPTEKESFFSELLRSFVQYNTRYRKVIFTFDETELIDSGTDVPTLCNQFHLIGAGFGISGFGGKSTLYPQLNRIHPDCIIFHPYFALTDKPDQTDFVQTVMAAATKGNIDAYLPAVDNDETAAAFSKLGFRGFGGAKAGNEISEKEFTRT